VLGLQQRGGVRRGSRASLSGSSRPRGEEWSARHRILKEHAAAARQQSALRTKLQVPAIAAPQSLSPDRGWVRGKRRRH